MGTVRSHNGVFRMELQGHQIVSGENKHINGQLSPPCDNRGLVQSKFTKSGGTNVNLISGMIGHPFSPKHRVGTANRSNKSSSKQSRSSKTHPSRQNIMGNTKPMSSQSNPGTPTGKKNLKKILDITSGAGEPTKNILQQDWNQRNKMMKNMNEMHQTMISKETRKRSAQMYKETLDKNNQEAIVRFIQNGGIDSNGKLKHTPRRDTINTEYRNVLDENDQNKVNPDIYSEGQNQNRNMSKINSS